MPWMRKAHSLARIGHSGAQADCTRTGDDLVCSLDDRSDLRYDRGVVSNDAVMITSGPHAGQNGTWGYQTGGAAIFNRNGLGIAWNYTIPGFDAQQSGSGKVSPQPANLGCTSWGVLLVAPPSPDFRVGSPTPSPAASGLFGCIQSPTPAGISAFFTAKSTIGLGSKSRIAI